MRINNYPVDPKWGQVTGTAAAEDSARTPPASADSPPKSSVYTSAPEFLQLRDLVRTTPEVRAELLKEIAGRLAAGDYATPEATDRTVEAILDSGAL